MNIIFGVFIGLIVLTLLVILHELGHFFMARKNGVKVNEFGIGFPPRAIAWIHLPGSKVKEYINNLPDKARKNLNQEKLNKILAQIDRQYQNSNTTKKQTKIQQEKYFWVPFPKSEYDKPQDYLIFSLNFLPIGGFCTMDGESAADTKKGTFGATNFWQKTQILFGGVLMNWLTAIVIFTVLAWTGMPSFLPHQFTIRDDARREKQSVIIEQVLANSPAEKAGIKVNSKIISMESNLEDTPAKNLDKKSSSFEVFDTESIISFNSEHQGQTVRYNLIDPNNTPYQVTAKLNSKSSDQPTLGISMKSTKQSFTRYTWSAPLVGLGTTLQLTGETFKGLGLLVSNLTQGVVNQFSNNQILKEKAKQQINEVGNSVSGPVGIIGVLFPAFTNAGPTNLAFLTAIISISLACMNVLPIPALDGGRFALIGLFKLRHKKLKKQTEEKIVSRAFFFLIALSIFITILDIIKIAR